MSDRLAENPQGITSTRPESIDIALDSAVTGAQSGDEQAIRFLYQTLQPRILSYLRAIVGETDAEDVASETWSRITRDLRTFRGDGDGFRAWAVTIARYRAIDHIRRHNPTTPLSPQDIPHQPAPDDPEHEAITTLGTTATLTIIAALPPDQAQAILLRVVVGLDTSATAKILGKRPGAVRTSIYRGLHNLAERLCPQTSNITTTRCQPHRPNPPRPARHGHR